MTAENFTLDQAREHLASLQRHELKDSAFGDMEIMWTDEIGEQLAWGYAAYASSTYEVGMYVPNTDRNVATTFSGDDARNMLELGNFIGRTENATPQGRSDTGE